MGLFLVVSVVSLVLTHSLTKHCKNYRIEYFTIKDYVMIILCTLYMHILSLMLITIIKCQRKKICEMYTCYIIQIFVKKYPHRFYYNN